MPKKENPLLDEVSFRVIFTQSPISTMIFNPEGTILLLNKAWEKLWKTDPKKIKKQYNILHDQQLVEKGIMPQIKQAFAGKIVHLPPIKYELDKTIPHLAKISHLWVSGIMYPIKDSKGKITQIVLQHEDMTALKIAEELQARQAAIVTSSDDAIVAKTLAGTITHWNKAAQKIFGYTAKEAIGKHISLIIPEELYLEEKTILERVRKGLHINHFETKRRTKSGKIINVSLSISPIKDLHGNIIGASKIARDITERIKMEEKLKQSQRQYQLVIEHATDLITVVDDQCNYLFASPSHINILGYTPLELLGKNGFSLIHPDDLAETKKQFAKALQGHIGHAVYRLRHKYGHWLTIESAGSAIQDHNGNASMVVITSHDITERIAAEKRKDDFLGIASHELRTPITSIKMYLRILENELKKSSQKKAITVTTKITGQTDKLTELVNDLLDVSRIQSGKLSLRKELIRLHDLIEEIIESIQETTSSKIYFKKEKTPKIYADQYRLYQVITNLLTNAIKYSPKNSEIIVRLTGNKDLAIVSVQDFGIGIAKSYHNKIFEKLYQIPEEKEKTFPGLGMGLYISKEIIERHGGKIWLQSDKGKGSTFYFSLPINSTLSRTEVIKN